MVTSQTQWAQICIERVEVTPTTAPAIEEPAKRRAMPTCCLCRRQKRPLASGHSVEVAHPDTGWDDYRWLERGFARWHHRQSQPG
ncbi:MAG: hypothetical protein R3D55_24180 [Chloroflexota bacterium]